jgi:O-antigen ligase
MIDLSLWGTFSEYNITIITSIFVNPNQLGALALIGTIAALEERLTTPTAGVGLLFGINVFGLFLSHYRTGWIALISSMGLFIIYSMWGRRALVFATVGGIFTIAIGLLMTFSIVPGPTAFSEISLNGRRELWTTSAHAFRERLWIGHGFAGTQEIVGNPHNSYLRMFASFGVIGGMIYTILVIGTAVGSARQTRTYRRVTLTAIIVSMLIVQIFNQLSFVGISMRSSLIAIFMGYYMTCTEL